MAVGPVSWKRRNALKVPIVRNILEANARIAEENRALFRSGRLLVINLMSSPGAGKTTLLERTIDLMQERYRIGVIEGDIQSSEDAERIARHGVPAVQINTGGACHLDGNMIRTALEQMDWKGLDLLVVENVGNLVCPAEFQLGEHFKIMILSVTEGDDKPQKYPLMFQESSVLLINKVDLLPYVNCRVDRIRQTASLLNPNLRIFEVSAATGEGFPAWVDWLDERIREERNAT